MVSNIFIYLELVHHHVLQVCAANFGEFCSIVGQEATEKLLVRSSQDFFFQHFKSLCNMAVYIGVL